MTGKTLFVPVEMGTRGTSPHALATARVVRQGVPLALILEAGETAAASLASSPAAAATTSPAPAAAPPSVVASPAAKRLAREQGIDLTTVRGTGDGGRITEDDVRQTIDAPAAAASSPASVPLAGMRGAIAQRMQASLRETAQLTLFTDVDVTQLVALRERLKGEGEVSYTDLLVKAVALSLREHPRLNAWLADNEVRPQPGIHVGVAVALDEGLIVPVVRDADRLSVAAIGQALRRLVAGARAGTLTPGEVTGATFSVTNLGMYGIDAFTPILNPPEVAILGVGRIVERAARQGDGLAWHSFLTLSLTFDHRAVDGAPAAQFLQILSRHLTNPKALEG